MIPGNSLDKVVFAHVFNVAVWVFFLMLGSEFLFIAKLNVISLFLVFHFPLQRFVDDA